MGCSFLLIYWHQAPKERSFEFLSPFFTNVHFSIDKNTVGILQL